MVCPDRMARMVNRGLRVKLEPMVNRAHLVSQVARGQMELQGILDPADNRVNQGLKDWLEPQD